MRTWIGVEFTSDGICQNDQCSHKACMVECAGVFNAVCDEIIFLCALGSVVTCGDAEKNCRPCQYGFDDWRRTCVVSENLKNIPAMVELSLCWLSSLLLPLVACLDFLCGRSIRHGGQPVWLQGTALPPLLARKGGGDGLLSPLPRAARVYHARRPGSRCRCCCCHDHGCHGCCCRSCLL